MTCRDAERLIDTFFDGELDGRLMREAAMHVTRCKRCESEISDREQLHDLLARALDDELPAIDSSRIWAGVEAAIEADVAARRRAGADGWLRIAAGSTRVAGVLLGRRAKDRRAIGASVASPDLDPAGEWLTVAPSPWHGRAWPLAGAGALAASILIAVLFATGGGPEAPRVASGPSPRVERHEALAASSSASSQVQVESVDYSGSSLAMWTEPETDTTVIWLEDDGSAPAVQR